MRSVLSSWTFRAPPQEVASASQVGGVAAEVAHATKVAAAAASVQPRSQVPTVEGGRGVATGGKAAAVMVR